MKKRILSILLAALMVVSMVPFAFAVTATVTEPATMPAQSTPPTVGSNTVFVDPFGSGDGSSEMMPTSSLSDAYTLLGDEGGTINFINSEYDLSMDIQMAGMQIDHDLGDGTTLQWELDGRYFAPAHTGLVILTCSMGGSLKLGTWNDSGVLGTTDGSDIKSNHFVCGGPTCFQNITVNTDATPVIYGMGNYLIFDNDGGYFTNPPILVGGYAVTKLSEYENPEWETTNYTTHVVLLGGTVSSISGMNRQAFGTHTGTANIEIVGGTVTDVYGIGQGLKTGTFGDSNVCVYGGTVSCIYGFGTLDYTSPTGSNVKINDSHIYVGGGKIGTRICGAFGPDSGNATTNEAAVTECRDTYVTVYNGDLTTCGTFGGNYYAWGNFRNSHVTVHGGSFATGTIGSYGVFGGNCEGNGNYNTSTVDIYSTVTCGVIGGVRAGGGRYIYSRLNIHTGADTKYAAAGSYKTTVSDQYSASYLYMDGGKVTELATAQLNHGSAVNTATLSYANISGGTITNLYLGTYLSSGKGRNSRRNTLVISGATTSISSLKLARSLGDFFIYGDGAVFTASDDGNSLLKNGTTVSISKNNMTTYPNNDNNWAAAGAATSGERKDEYRLNIKNLGTLDTVYVGGPNAALHNSGVDAANAVADLMDAYFLLGDDGGTIKICGEYTVNALGNWATAPAGSNIIHNKVGFVEPPHSGLVTITGDYDATDAVGKYILTAGHVLSGNTKFENIELSTNSTSSCDISACYNELTMGAGVVVDSAKADIFKISGAYFGGHGGFANDGRTADTHITINSGTYNYVSAFARAPEFTKDFPGAGSVQVNGGKISNLYAGPTGVYGATGASAFIELYGGVVDTLYNGGYTSGAGAITGDVTININYDSVAGVVAAVNNFSDVDNCDGMYTINANGYYSDYIKATRCTAKDTVITTITDPGEYKDRIASEGAFSLRDDSLGMRFTTVLDADVIDSTDFKVLEFGTLIKKADNANPTTYFEGYNFYGSGEIKQDEGDLDATNKIAKSVNYVRNADTTPGAPLGVLNKYIYDGTSTDVTFTGILDFSDGAGNLITSTPNALTVDFEFTAYMVVNVNGMEQVVYGTPVVASAEDVANMIIADSSASTEDIAVANTLLGLKG